MIDTSGLRVPFRGNNIYVDARVGNDAWIGSDTKPLKTITEALTRARPGKGDKIFATSDLIHSPPTLYAFTENVVFNVSDTALFGPCSILPPSGVALELYDVGVDSIGGVLIQKVRLANTSGIRLHNAVECTIADVDWFCSIEPPGEVVGFDLYVDEFPLEDPELFGDNKFLRCRARGGNFANTLGWRLNDHGISSNLLIECILSKLELGAYIANSALEGNHGIIHCQFSDNEEHCDQDDDLHHWHLIENYYDDVEPNTDGWSKWRPWPYPGKATWFYALIRSDLWALGIPPAIYADKIHSLESINALINTTFQHR